MKNLLITLIVAMAMFTGCTTENVLQSAQTLYTDIKIIVTDETIKAEIPADVLTQIYALEPIYLAAVTVLETDSTNQDALTTILNIGNRLLLIIADLEIPDKYANKITAIRLAIKVLTNHIQLE